MARNDAALVQKEKTMRALITGASAGIGEDLARCFAADKHDVVLVARRAEKLSALAAELEERHGISAEVIAHDLGEPGSAATLIKEIEERELRIDALVNNAGIGQTGPFAEADARGLETMLVLNMLTLTSLTRHFLPRFIERGFGYVLNVGSTAGFQPGPHMAAYYATKAYVYSLTEGLVEECKGTGVTITNLSPGATDTEFQHRAGNADSVLFAVGVMSSDRVARAGYKGMLKGKSLVVPGWTNKMVASTSGFVPRLIVRKVTSRLNQAK